MMDTLRQIVGREFGGTNKLTAADFSAEEYQERRRKITDKYRDINYAVAAGVATVHQVELHTVKATTHRAWRSLPLLRRELQKKDPGAYKELQAAENEAKKFRARKPSPSSLFDDELKLARIDRISREGWIFQPASNIELFELFLELESLLYDLLERNIVYIGITTLDGPKAELEFCRWALKLKASEIPAITKVDGSIRTTKEDLNALGFKIKVLAEHSFAYNMRRVETLLQTAFFDCRNRCWRARGAGSYWTSRRELDLRKIDDNIDCNITLAQLNFM